MEVLETISIIGFILNVVFGMVNLYQFKTNKMNEKDNRIQRNITLKNNIRKDFSKLLNFKKPQMNPDILLRSTTDNSYPDEHVKNWYGKYTWYKVELDGLYSRGIEVTLGEKEVLLYKSGEWDIVSDTNYKGNYKFPIASKVGRINYNDIVKYDMYGDSFSGYPYFHCKFKHQGSPYEQIVYYITDSYDIDLLLENENRRCKKISAFWYKWG